MDFWVWIGVSAIVVIVLRLFLGIIRCEIKIHEILCGEEEGNEMPCVKTGNGKWKLGSSKVMYRSKAS